MNSLGLQGGLPNLSNLKGGIMDNPIILRISNGSIMDFDYHGDSYTCSVLADPPSRLILIEKISTLFDSNHKRKITFEFAGQLRKMPNSSYIGKFLGYKAVGTKTESGLLVTLKEKLQPVVIDFGFWVSGKDGPVKYKQAQAEHNRKLKENPDYIKQFS